jgi:hypothetical protein
VLLVRRLAAQRKSPRQEKAGREELRFYLDGGGVLYKVNYCFTLIHQLHIRKLSTTKAVIEIHKAGYEWLAQAAASGTLVFTQKT